MSKTPIFDRMLDDLVEQHSTRAIVFLEVKDPAMRKTIDWLSSMAFRQEVMARASDDLMSRIYLPKQDVLKTKEELLVEAKNWRARYKTESPYIGFK